MKSSRQSRSLSRKTAHAASLMRLVIFLKELNSLLMDRIDLLGLTLPDRRPLNLPTSFRHPSLQIRYLHRSSQLLDPTSSSFDPSNKLWIRIFHNSLAHSPVSLCQ